MVIQSSQFFSGSSYSCFDEAFFFLTIRMPMVTKLFRVVRCWEEVSPTNMHATSMGWHCGVTRQKKYMPPLAGDVWTPNLVSCWLSVRSSQTWPFDQVTKVRSRDLWKIYISTFVRFIANKLGRLLTLGRIFSTQTLKSSPTSCLFFLVTLVTKQLCHATYGI